MEFELETPEISAPAPKAGEMIRAARLAIGMDAEKLCTTLRIAPSVLAAMEACEYDHLPGEPYVRALLGSLARALNIDSAKLLQAYNNETGIKPAEIPAKPYADTSQVHILAHRKLFVAILMILLVALLFILGKVNSSSDKNVAPITTAPHSDTTAVIAPPESASESSLQPDSLAGKADSAIKTVVKPVVKTDTAKVVSKPAAAKTKSTDTIKTPIVVKPKTDTVQKAAPIMNRISVKPLVDSVWMRVVRKGKPESVILLRKANPPVDVSNNDTIVLILSQRRSVEIAVGDTTVIPSRKKFKVFGKNISY